MMSSQTTTHQPQMVPQASTTNDLLYGFMLLIGSCVLAFAAFILGMMLISVMGGVNAGPNIPNWYNLAMWIGWPTMLAITAIAPSVCLWITKSWRLPVGVLIGGGVISFVWFVVGLVLMVSYGMKG